MPELIENETKEQTDLKNRFSPIPVFTKRQKSASEPSRSLSTQNKMNHPAAAEIVGDH
ncbi:hypothetical protein J0A68_19555 [Algoriphagus sp. H41]|uniref:Uncharacterized protein n=1 Tax=Algoriphagus oliviformis TaxID=2811231 RepID=A0ABS3C9D0_9BACT|nr:hypothetical protein [Algoriphagus oliviformis]MBN7813161.1 hypothetical protein [Algoriphagus oliviformis]